MSSVSKILSNPGLCINESSLTYLAASVAWVLVRSAHPLYGEAWSPGHLVVVLRRRVHDGGDQQLLEVLVGVDEKVVLPADSEVTTAAEPLFSRHCQYRIMNAESDSL